LYSTSSEHSPIIDIPTVLLMSNQSATNSATFVPPTSAILDQTDEHIDRETLLLSLFLLHERARGIGSHWYPYIQILPATFSTPLFHTANYVENTSVFYLAQTMLQSMTEVYSLLGMDTFALDDFLWAYTVVSSRAFRVTDLGTVLIPLADLANHVSVTGEANLRTMGIDKPTDRYVLKHTDKPVVEGEELCIKYDELANWQLLLYYGFAIEDNPFESIFLELQIDVNDTYEMEMKKTLLLNLSSEVSLDCAQSYTNSSSSTILDDDLALEHELKITENESVISTELVGSLRLLVMSSEELEQYNISNIDQLVPSRVNADNERRALTKLDIMLSELHAALYTTTLVANVQRLQAKDLHDDERYSLIFLVGQKRIIDKARRWIERALSQLE
jgi:hypothetical protein